MAAKEKSFKSSDVVVVVELDKGDGTKKKFSVEAGVFGPFNFDGMVIVSGEDYYVKKAVERGAKKA